MNKSDAKLVRQSLSGKAGANEAFGRLVARYRPTILGLAFAATGQASEAEDLSQETLIAACLSLSHLRDLERFCVWLYCIARNLVQMTPVTEGHDYMLRCTWRRVVSSTRATLDQATPSTWLVRVGTPAAKTSFGRISGPGKVKKPHRSGGALMISILCS